MLNPYRGTNKIRENSYSVLTGESKGRESFGRPRRRWEDNIKIFVSKTVGGMDWINLAEDRDKWHPL
jgi:hypothetical protein